MTWRGDDAPWRALALVSCVCAALAAFAALAPVLEVDHLWILAGLVLLGASMRALTRGDARAVLVAAGTTAAAQPLIHVLGEVTHVEGPHVVGHGATMNVLTLLGHLLLVGMVLAGLHVLEWLVPLALSAMRRLVRLILATVPAVPAPGQSRLRRRHVVLSRAQRECSPPPLLRGPPLVATATV